VAAAVEGSYQVDTDLDPYLQTKNVYYAASCPECHKPFLLQQGATQDPNTGEWDYDEPSVLYPSMRSLDAAVPAKIAAAFNEAAACLGANACTATAIMCRRTVEGLCHHHGAKQGNLKMRLEQLKESGVIEQRLFEWAEQLRLAGNDAAHDIDVVVEKQDARDLVEFTRALLEYVFTFKNAFEQFRSRRDARRQNPTPPG
jgi:hypothetical protein